MATAYDNWKLDNGIDEAEEARDEAIGEMADDLISEWSRDAGRVDDALEAAIDGGFLPDIRAELAIFFATIESANGNDHMGMSAAAIALWRAMTPHVEAALKDTAEAEAASKYDEDAREFA